MSRPVYEHDPEQAPDQDFVPGELRHLVSGNEGRLLDARRTPVAVIAVRPGKGEFEVQIEAFEDQGARWVLPLDDVDRFQFALDATHAMPAHLRELETARARFDRELVIEVDDAARRRTLDRIAAGRRALRDRFGAEGTAPDLGAMIARREGDARLFEVTEDLLAERGVADLDVRFAETFVSNPHSGEMVKGHAIVLAELGLSPYRGKIVRDPALFTGSWSKAARAEHLIARLALSRELWSGWGYADVRLYRGAAVDDDVSSMPPRSSFVSATFSSEVAAEHFIGGPGTHTAVMWRRQVPVDRLLMTFVETRAFNGRFKEAEAVLIGEPGSESL